MKTGALITAAAEMGCVAAGGAQEQRAAVRRYAEKLGLAFQIQDDILDVVGNAAALGKSVGSDARSEKTTFVTLKGVETCRKLVRRLTEEAKEALDRLKNGAPAPAKGSAAKPSALPKEGARKDPPKGGFLKGLFGGRKDR